MRPEDTDTFHLFGNLVRFLTRSCENGGAYCLVEVLSAPGAGAPPNRHPEDDEAFYVLEGAFEFTVGAQVMTMGPGGHVRIPKGEVHAFKNVGGTPGRLLVINAPGRVHDGFFSQVGEPMPPGTRELPPMKGPPDIPRIVEIAKTNGMEFILPDSH